MDTCKSLVLRFGNFHIIQNYIKVIDKHCKDSGLEDVWIESSTFGENIAHNNLEGKSYNRAVQAHRLIYETVWRIICPKFLYWAEENNMIIPELLDMEIDMVLNGLKSKECS